MIREAGRAPLTIAVHTLVAMAPQTVVRHRVAGTMAIACTHGRQAGHLAVYY